MTPWCKVAPMVLSRLGFIILSTKFPQDLTFIGIISKAMDESVFRFYFQVPSFAEGVFYKTDFPLFFILSIIRQAYVRVDFL